MSTGETVFSERWADIVGYTLEELEPTSIDTWTQLANADDLLDSNDLIMRHIQGLVPFYEITVRMRHKDGHWVWVRDRGMIVEWNQKGEPTRMVGTHTDVTDLVQAAQAIEESERRFSAMFREHDAIMLLVEPTIGSIVDANIAATHFYGYSLDEMKSMLISDINVLPVEEIRQRREEARSRGLQHFVFPHRLANGQMRMVDVHSSPIVDAGRTLLFSVITDVTAKEESEARLREAAAVFDNLTEVVLLSDPDGVVRRVNPALTAVTGWTAEQFVGRHTREIAGQVAADTKKAHVKQAHQKLSTSRVEMPIVHADGSLSPGMVTVNPIVDETGLVTGFVTLISDLTDRVDAERQRLDEATNVDALTGLPNRTGFGQLLTIELEQLRASGATASLILVDLDRFQSINDSYGHEAGDQVLRETAMRLRGLTAPGDLLARLGPDEFVLVSHAAVSRDVADRTASRLAAALGQSIALPEGEEVFPSGCIGIVELSGAVSNQGELLQNADAALHEAKRHGPGSRRHHAESLVEDTRARLSLETRLRRAWDNGDLTLHYQPMIDVKTNRIIGAEELLRWTSDTGPIPPSDFVPAAERIGLMPEIGHWVLREACRQAAAWNQAGLSGLTIAVNVAAQQLHEARFLDDVTETLQVTGLAPELLELEITESAFLSSADGTYSLLDRLTDLGVRLAIDDFGTGYSSFAYLRRLPVDMLKIDRSFVSEIESNADDRAIVAAIISMGHDLGLQVLAEGVETVGQLAFLNEHACDVYQGFLLSKALPPDTFAELARSAMSPSL